MADSFDNAYFRENYSNGFGFCVEYDTDKIPIDVDELKDLHKVIYTDDRGHFSWLPLFLLAINSGDTNMQKKELENEFKTQLITKDTKWEKEQEYRFFGDKSNKVYADIIIAIYLTASILETKEAKELIDIANKRNYKVLVRKFDENTKTSVLEEII